MPDTDNLEALVEHIRGAFEDIHVDRTTPDFFFFAGEERKFPFATIVTRDTEFDSQSRLNRPGVFRLNLGVRKESFRELFPESDTQPLFDFAALDTLVPNPVYGRMFWLSVLNPSQATLQRLHPLLQEAHDLQAQRTARR